MPVSYGSKITKRSGLSQMQDIHVATVFRLRLNSSWPRHNLVNNSTR